MCTGCMVPVSMRGIEGKGTAGEINAIGRSGTGNVQGARAVPIQSYRSQGQVAVGFNSDAATPTGCGSQSVATFCLQGTGYGYRSTLQPDCTTGSTPATLCMCTGSITPICPDTARDREHTIAMGKKFHRSTPGTTGVEIAPTGTGTTQQLVGEIRFTVSQAVGRIIVISAPTIGSTAALFIGPGDHTFSLAPPGTLAIAVDRSTIVSTGHSQTPSGVGG